MILLAIVLKKINKVCNFILVTAFPASKSQKSINFQSLGYEKVPI